MSDEVIGYIVLTRSLLGGWKDDWDGEVHLSYEAGFAEWEIASTTCGECLLAELHPIAQHVTANDPEDSR